MKSFLVTLVLMIFILSGVSQAAGFEVTKVIQVDNIVGGPMLGPIKWSPDGLKLSYFKKNQLYISDTLGNTNFISELEYSPHRYEWISNDKLAIHIKKYDGPTSDNKLISVDINSHEESIISSFTYKAGFGNTPGFETFRGPFLTNEGHAYYEIHRATGEKSFKEIESNFFENDKLKSPDNKTILRGEHDIYKIDLNTNDSVFLLKKPVWKGYIPVFNKDENLILIGHFLYNISNSTLVDFEPYFTHNLPPQIDGCGYLYYSFNPKYPEIIFKQSCDSVDLTTIERVALFNYKTNESFLMETVTGHETGSAPIFHPYGKMIAYGSKGILYIIYRED